MGVYITEKELKEKIYNLVGDEYTLIGYKKGMNTRQAFRHNKCGRELVTTPNHFIYSNQRCHCKNHYNSKTPQQFEEEFYEKGKNEWKLLSEYTRSVDKIKVEHLKCGNIFYVRATEYLKKQPCRYCRGNIRKTTKQFSQEVYDEGKGDYELLSSYKNNRTKVKIKHKTCGNIYDVTPKDFLRGNRCPRCKESKGERMVAHILDDLGYVYEREKIFCDLKNKGSYLPYDFYLPKQKILIEYDGEQHYKPTGWGEERFKSQQRRDRVKNEYAKDKGYPLLRIPYTKSKNEVEIIIKEFFLSVK